TLRLGQTCVLAFFSFAVLTFVQSGWYVIKYSQRKVSANVADAGEKSSQDRSSKRILWILFDELDQRVAFDERPSSINLPELDRFKSESFISTNAYPPANYTAFSMPALISGRLVSSATPINPHDMMLKFDGASTAVKWNEQPNV